MVGLKNCFAIYLAFARHLEKTNPTNKSGKAALPASTPPPLPQSLVPYVAISHPIMRYGTLYRVSGLRFHWWDRGVWTIKSYRHLFYRSLLEVFAYLKRLTYLSCFAFLGYFAYFRWRKHIYFLQSLFNVIQSKSSGLQ